MRFIKERCLLLDTYDACVTSGAFGEGHIPCEGVREMARVTKPGGYVLIVMRQAYLTSVDEYRERLEPLMQRMAGAGEHVWSPVARVELPRYSFDNAGLVFVFRKNPLN